MDPGVIHNNRLVLLTADDGRKLVLKRYYRDDRGRLEREFGAFAYLRAHGFDAVPVPHLRDDAAYAAVYSFEPGRTKLPHELTRDDLTAIGRLAGQLHTFDPNVDGADFPPAFAARSWAARAAFLRRRATACLAAADLDDAYPELRAVVADLRLADRLPDLIARLTANLTPADVEAPIPDAFMRFNPGDFAPHNLLIDGSRVCAIDFEYFGPEEAAALPVSFLAAEQSADLTPAQAEAFLAAYHAHRDVPDLAFERYPRLRALFEVSWVLVNFSLMTPAHVARKQFAGDFDLADHLAERAAKLRRRLVAAEAMVAAL